MQTPSINEIKKELLNLEVKELTALALRMAKYKKENKELLSYLLFESENETQFIHDIQLEIDNFFEELNYIGAYKFTKQIRKILRYTSKHIKYAASPVVEIELLFHFCKHLRKQLQKLGYTTVLENIFDRQIDKIEKAMGKLHEDLRYDYVKPLQQLKTTI